MLALEGDIPVYSRFDRIDNRFSYRADIILMLNRGNRRLTVSPLMENFWFTMLKDFLGQPRRGSSAQQGVGRWVISKKSC